MGSVEGGDVPEKFARGASLFNGKACNEGESVFWRAMMESEDRRLQKVLVAVLLARPEAKKGQAFMCRFGSFMTPRFISVRDQEM